MKKTLAALMVLSLVACASREHYIRVAKEALPTTVAITALVTVHEADDLETSHRIMVSGSGVFISPNGHVLTCAHVVDGAEPISISVCDYSGTCQHGEIVFVDPAKDLALLQVGGSSPAFAALGERIEIGQEVIAIGGPFGLLFSVSHGIVSALNRDTGLLVTTTQSDVAINSGNSGGPLFNLDGELIGVNSQIYSPVGAFVGLSFSVSAKDIHRFLERFRGLNG